MASRNYIRIKTTNNIHNIPFGPDHIYSFNSLKKAKNNFLHNKPLQIQNKIIYHRPNLYRSFGNYSSPFIYNQNSQNKNNFLINYNGGPQNKLYSFAKENFQKNLNNKEEIIFENLKPCGCRYKSSINKLNKNLTNVGINTNKNCYFPDKNFTRNFNGLKTAKAFRFSKDGKIIYTLKKFKENNNEIIKNLRYENKMNNENEYDKKCCRFYNSCFCFRPKQNKKFHKTQIFNLCKPFLVDDFQEFPD